jgi:pfkB family carbohydrate kinase
VAAQPYFAGWRNWRRSSIFSSQTIMSATASPSRLTIALIGGDKQGYPQYEHDYLDGILMIERIIQGAPQLQALDPHIKAFPADFHSDLSQIADADVVVLYFGADYHPPRMTNPLEDPARLAAMERLMAKGVGLISLHQAYTVADQTSPVPFADWLGGIGSGMADGTQEIAPIRIAHDSNPIGNGLKAFDYLDEFYPTITFSKTTRVTPILIARVHIQTRNNKPVFEEPPADHVIAWATVRRAGMVLTQLELPLATVGRLAQVCEELNVPLMLDPSPAQFLDESILSRVSWFTPNETEARFYTHISDDDDAAIEKLFSNGVRNVILKRGSDGALIACADGNSHLVAAVSVDAVDTTAAGDSFNGAFAVARLRGLGLEESARYAATAAAIAVTRKGAQTSLPTREEVDILLERLNCSWPK